MPHWAADLTRHEISLADHKLIAIYGDMVHRNNGCDLYKWAEGNAAMQMLYDRVVDHLHPIYSPPKGKVEDMFILLFIEELAKVGWR